MRRWLGPALVALAALLLIGAACRLAFWAARDFQFHCGCASVQCNLPCVDCCTGATPSGCPLPGAGDVLEIPPPTPEDELVRSGRGALHFPEPIPGGCGPGVR